MRHFTAATNELRCKWDIKLKDGSGAQCMRAAKDRGLCLQHRKIRDAMNFKCCGGTDMHPPEHTTDCDTKE